MDLTDPDLVLPGLEAELSEARSELADYELLLQDLPAIYEDKFRQHLRSTAQNIRQLLDERKVLQERISLALTHSSRQQSFAAFADDLSQECRPSIDLSTPTSGNSSNRFVSFLDHYSRTWKLLLVAGGALVGLVFVSYPLLTSFRLSPPEAAQKSNKRAVLPIAYPLTVVAKGGQSWILIESNSGLSMLDVVLDDGETRLINIGSGLRIRSGRPDLLYIGIGSEPLRQLGGVSDLDWTEIRQQI